MTSSGGGWAQLRQQTRSLESQTETLFNTYSQYASMAKVPPTASEEEQRTESQLKEILEKVRDL
jgi:golgi SNAP receptor complex member 1